MFNCNHHCLCSHCPGCHRYPVPSVSRAVTRVAVRETRAAEVKAEILNSERLASHFDENPADLQLLQHDRQTTHVSKVQDHLKHVPKYMLPRGMEVSESVGRKRRKKKTRSQRLAHSAKGANGRERNKANDPLQNFDGDVNMDGLLDNDDGDDDAEGDDSKFFDGGDSDGDGAEITKESKNQACLDEGEGGYGKSTAGRNAWKQKHGKGKYNRKYQKERQEHLHKW